MNNITQSIGISLLALILLSACSSNQEAVSNTGHVETGVVTENNGSSSSSESNSQQKGPEGMMDEGQMSLMSTFRSLMMLDEQEGLEITKAQAELMLPMVQAAITADTLSDEDATNLKAQLTDEQQAYITSIAEQMPQGGMPGTNGPGQGQGQGQGQGPANGGMPPEGDEGPAIASPPDGQAPQPPSQRTDEQGERPQGDPDMDTDMDNMNMNNGQGRGPAGANMGQQLIELLQSKIGGAEL